MTFVSGGTDFGNNMRSCENSDALQASFIHSNWIQTISFQWIQCIAMTCPHKTPTFVKF